MSVAEVDAASRPKLPLSAAGDRQTLFADPAVDHLMAMVLELAAEVWVTRECLYRVERAARTGGLDLPTLAEDLGLSETDETELRGMRETFTRNLFRTLNREPSR